jgi:hypothetical protein
MVGGIDVVDLFLADILVEVKFVFIVPGTHRTVQKVAVSVLLHEYQVLAGNAASVRHSRCGHQQEETHHIPVCGFHFALSSSGWIQPRTALRARPVWNGV